MSFFNVMLRLGLMLSLWAIVLFVSAGTFLWVEAWICFIIATLGFGGINVWFWKRNQSLVQSRSEFRIPPKKWDRIVMSLAILAILSLFPVAGLDFRFQWSIVPLILKIGGLVIFSLSFIIIFLVMRENSYLLKVVEVQKNHEVVSSGPYKLVRHPMYFGVILMVVSVSIALGTILALIPAFLVTILLIIRIHFEEKTLLSELTGYKEYIQRVCYRLVPKIW